MKCGRAFLLPTREKPPPPSTTAGSCAAVLHSCGRPAGSQEVVKIANTLLSRVREKLQQSAEKVLKKVQAVLLKPEVKQAGKEQIKNKARKSIKEKLAQGKLDADRENRERWEREGRIAPTRKQDMEL